MLKTRSRSRHPLEQLLCELAPAELFVVSSLRLWMESHTGGPNAGLDWRQGFRIVGIDPEAADAFDALCHILVGGAKQPDIRALFCTRMGRDEARALHLLGLLQQQRLDAAQALLDHWHSPTVARLVMQPVLCFATALSHCRLSLPASGNLCHEVQRTRVQQPARLDTRRARPESGPVRRRRGLSAEEARGRQDVLDTLH